jgi:hypothetical protein
MTGILGSTWSTPRSRALGNGPFVADLPKAHRPLLMHASPSLRVLSTMPNNVAGLFANTSLKPPLKLGSPDMLRSLTLSAFLGDTRRHAYPTLL